MWRKHQLIIMILFLLALAGCSVNKDEIVRINTSYSEGKDWTDESIPYISNNIFVGEILEMVDTYQYNEADKNSVRRIPVTHYKVKMITCLRGDIQEEIVDMFFYGGKGIDDKIYLYDFSVKLPKIGDTYIIFANQPGDTMLTVDSRLFDGVYDVWPREELFIRINYGSDEITQEDDIQRIIENIIELETTYPIE